MRTLVIALSLALVAPAQAATGYLVNQFESGNIRICVYQVSHYTVTRTISRMSYCPYSIQV